MSFNEICANLEFNKGFREFTIQIGQHYIHPIYGSESLRDEKGTKKEWLATHKVWYKDSFEASLSTDAAFALYGFEGWKNEKEEAAFLRALRKVGSGNAAIRTFMRQYDPEWDF